MLTGKLPGGGNSVAFGAAIMDEPSVLFLDEPTSALTLWRAARSGG